MADQPRVPPLPGPIHRVSYVGARLRGSDLSYLNLEGADFRAADLRGVNFTGSKMRYCDFRGANAVGANFQNADLYGSRKQGLDARQSDFRGANIEQTHWGGAFVEGAVLPPPQPPIDADYRPPPDPLAAPRLPQPSTPDPASRARFQQKDDAKGHAQ
jgi:hypothetical protein